jgi:hypothetical protein
VAFLLAIIGDNSKEIVFLDGSSWATQMEVLHSRAGTPAIITQLLLFT